MKLSQLIARLQQLAAEADGADPRVFSGVDERGLRRMVFDASLTQLNPAGSDTQNAPQMLGVSLTMRHFSHHPEFYEEWKALDDAWWASREQPDT